MKKVILTSLFLIAGAAQAQIPADPPVILPVRPAPYAQDLTKYLGLSAAQVLSLSSIADARMQASQAIYKQIADKQIALNALLASGSNDALTIGQLSIDIRNLQKQAQPTAEPWRTQALAVLTAEQKNKLPALTAAIELQNAAWQAVNLDLLDGPSLVPFPKGE